jgi:hypothetical protein
MTSWSTKKKRSTNGFPLFSLTILLKRKLQALSVIIGKKLKKVKRWPNCSLMMTDNACNFLLRRMVSENKGNPFVDLFFFVLQEVISVNFTGF